MQSALAWSPLDRRVFLYTRSQPHHERTGIRHLAPVGAAPALTAVSPRQSLRKVPAVPSEPSAAQGLQAPVGYQSVPPYAGVSYCTQSLQEGMTGLLTRHSSPGSQAEVVLAKRTTGRCRAWSPRPSAGLCVVLPSAGGPARPRCPCWCQQ